MYMALSMNDVYNHTLTFNQFNVNETSMGEIESYRARGYLLHILVQSLHICTMWDMLHKVQLCTMHYAQCTKYKVISPFKI